MQAVLRVEGANIIPFTANNLNIFVTAVVAQLPNVTAKDIVISQVCSLSSDASPLLMRLAFIGLAAHEKVRQ